MAQALTVNILNTALDGTGNYGTARPIVLTSNRVISVKTLTTAINTSGITEVLYAVPINNSETQASLICTESRAAILALLNAPLA